MAKPSQSTSSRIYSTCRTPADCNAPIPCIGTLPGGAQHSIPEGAFITQRWLVKQRAILLMLCAIKSQYRFINHLVHLVASCSAGLDTMQILGDINVSLPCSCTQIFIADISLPQKTGQDEREASLAREDVKYASAFQPCQVKFGLHIRLVMHMVNFFHSLLVSLEPSWSTYSISVPQWHNLFYCFDRPLLMMPRSLGTDNLCIFTNDAHLQSCFSFMQFCDSTETHQVPAMGVAPNVLREHEKVDEHR